MKTSRYLAIGTAIVSLSLAACGGGGGTRAVPAPSLVNPGTPAGLQSFAWGANLLKGATQAGAANPQGTIGMQVLVTLRNANGLVQYAQQVSDPHSAVYRHFLTPAEIADRFGASQANYQSAAGYFAQYGLHVSGWPQRETIFVTGPIGGFEKAFNTQFSIYRSGTESFVAPSGSPHLSSAAPIAAVEGLVHLQTAHDYLMQVPAGNFRGYVPQQMQRAFDFTGAASAGYDGSGINIAIVGTGPISSADVPALAAETGLTKVGSLTQVDVTDQGVTSGLGLNSPSPSPLPSGTTWWLSSGFQPAPPVTAPCFGSLPACNPEDYEAQLDTETITTMVPGANTLFYLAYNPNDCYYATGVSQGNTPCAAGQGQPAEGIALADAEIQQIIADDKADVVSLSYGLGEPFGVSTFASNTSGYYDASGHGFGPVEFATMVAEGMAVFAASGDTGAYECGGLGAYYLPGQPCTSYPAGDPSVVSVGGVTAPLNNDGTLATQFTAWGFQTTAGGNGSYGNNIGSGGGISTVFPAPPWQAALSDVNAIGHGMRVQPDISMMADPASGPLNVANAAFGAQWFADGGTSLAAPQMASLWSLVLEACKNDATCDSKGTGAYPYRLGNPAPIIYGIYANKQLYESSTFDVLYGDNSANNPYGQLNAGYQAGPGYDLVTGVGVPLAGHFIDAVLHIEGDTNPAPIP